MRVFRRMLMSPAVQWSGRIFSREQSTTSTVPDVIEKRNLIFLQEQRRQLEQVGRVEQISVEISGPPEDAVLMMNQHISTPYDCCRHISEALCQRSPLALVDDKILWDMHRPLPGNCKLKFLSFKDKDPFSLNEAFWRTGSFVLGAIILKAFKSEVSPRLRQFPECRVNTGSFFYDIELSVKEWVPTEDELKVLSAEFLTFVFQNHKIERLAVNKSVALQIFEDNPYKVKEISKQFLDSGDAKVVLYKVGDHIDICNGPMVANTSFFGRASVAACHCLSTEDTNRFRVQAVALPKGIMLNSFAYSVLYRRATRMNEIPVPDVEPEHQFYSGLCPTNSTEPIDPNPHHVRF